ncbi:MAG TPA: hypothetical protein VG963_02390, partial [Polyangiaceae bacterium]|nr:hypothetical protein [Polyangiaceae bacterium]
MGLSPGERRAVLLAPLPLRALLGVTFLWAGLGKVLSQQSVVGQDAAVLANMGVVAPPPQPTPQPDAPSQPLPEPRADAQPRNAGQAAAPLVLAVLSASPSSYQATDFPQPVQVRRLWGIALTAYHAAHPAPASTGAAGARPPFAIWPVLLSEGLFPKVQALGVTGLEIAGGSFLLIGFFTRLLSLGFA